MKKASELNIREIEKKINYTFKDKSLLIQAFTRTSYCNEINPTAKVKLHSNEVLEFFGDGVLSLSIITFLLKECTERYEHGIRTELGEGDFSNIKSKLSDKQNLSKSMKALGLEKHLLMGEGDEKLGIQNEPSVMEDLFESIIGAIFIDSDMSIGAVIGAVTGMLDMSVYTDRQKVFQSAKNALQEWCADKKHRLSAPRYETLSEDGPDHKKTYMRGVYIGDKLMGRGIGKNFKLADAAAAEDALKTLMAQNEQNMQSKIVKKEQNESAVQSSTTTDKNAKATINVATPTKASPSEKPSVKVQNASLKLKNYATSNKKPSPVFRDLGQHQNGKTVECRVECSFMEKVTLGSGKTRIEARETACLLMLEALGAIKKKSAVPTQAPKSQSAKSPAQPRSFKKPDAAVKPSQSKGQKKVRSNPIPQKKKSSKQAAKTK